MKNYAPSKDFLRVAAVRPLLKVGSVAFNVDQIISLYEEQCQKGASLVVTPELSLCGYTLGDLLHHQKILSECLFGLEKLRHATRNGTAALVVGVPLEQSGNLYNCAVVLAGGKYIVVVPKQALPNQNEFYEQRWFSSGCEIVEASMTLGGEEVAFCTKSLFTLDGVKIGVELCEDAWVNNPPHQTLVSMGAEVICNLSASPELVGKSQFRRSLIEQISARSIAGYIYVSAGPTESTADVVMSGHSLIYENGHLLAELPAFCREASILADIDIAHLRHDRRQNNNFRVRQPKAVINSTPKRQQQDLLRRYPSLPFVPSSNDKDALETIVSIQSHGLLGAVRQLQHQRVVLGLSGGLDSTLALLVAHRAAIALGIETKKFIHTLTMPSKASSDRTQGNAVKLAGQLGAMHTTIPIHALVTRELAALGHDTAKEDVTFENVQARRRTSFLFNYANLHGGLVLGTGDMSEIALGWCTYNGDHMSGYNVNAGVPKTLVRQLVTHLMAELKPDIQRVIKDILETPISPELTGDGNKDIQVTEDIIGPYELHDFFLYHFIRWGESAEKIFYLACLAFDDYDKQTIEKYLKVFLRRFMENQWKREAVPNAPKIGTVSLSPRGDWRMPPGISVDAIL